MSSLQGRGQGGLRGQAPPDRAHAAQAVLSRHADALDGFPVAAALATWPLRAGAAAAPLLCLLARWCAHLDEDIAVLQGCAHPSARPALARLLAARAAIAELIDAAATPDDAATAGEPAH